MTKAALIAVAHPDDEAFFTGQLMLENPSWDWTVVTATYGPGDGRHEEFLEYADVVGFTPTTLGLEDTGTIPSPEWYESLESGMRRLLLKGTAWDIVITHNRLGDYGHPHHIAVNQAVRCLFSNVWEFAHPRLTGVGSQWLGHLRVGTSRCTKEDTFTDAYRSHWQDFTKHHPGAAKSLSGVEFFTAEATGRWPS
jgi:LmbE family N-acetylglucosaminyl deacetylase